MSKNAYHDGKSILDINWLALGHFLPRTKNEVLISMCEYLLREIINVYEKKNPVNFLQKIIACQPIKVPLMSLVKLLKSFGEKGMPIMARGTHDFGIAYVTLENWSKYEDEIKILGLSSNRDCSSEIRFHCYLFRRFFNLFGQNGIKDESTYWLKCKAYCEEHTLSIKTTVLDNSLPMTMPQFSEVDPIG